MSKTAFITGGCGFVGRHVTKRLVNDGYSLWVLDNLSTGKDPVSWLPNDFSYCGLENGAVVFRRRQQKIHFIQKDAIAFISEQLRLSKSISETRMPTFDKVIHLASVVGGRMVIEGNPMAVAIDLAIDALFFQWVVKQKKVGAVLYASSSAAYPVHLQSKKKHVALKESYIQFNDKLGLPDLTYGWSKLTGEYLAQFAAQKTGLSVACIRPFSGYGGDQDQSYPVPAIARRAAKKENPLIVWGTGEQGRDFVHIDDCVDAMLIAMKKISDGSGVNIGTGKLTTFKEVAGVFASLAGYDPEIKPLIDKPMGVQSRYANTSTMKKILNWKPKISLEEGFKRVLEEQIAAI